MKNAFVTGGSRGIGAAVVRSFAKNGYTVAFTYKNSDMEAEALAKEFGAMAIRADSEKPDDIMRAASLASEKLGFIECLVNNAAISSFSLLSDLSYEEWNKTLAVNLTAPFLYSKAFIPAMVSHKYGRIINVSSVWGLVGSSCEAHYSATKAGIIGLTKALAKELGPSGITVNAIAPGVINTDMNSTCETPLMRIGEPDEVASLVSYLTSDSASFITGEVFNISGGFVI